MSEYFTKPDPVGTGTRTRSANLNGLSDATEDGFDALPSGLQDTQDEVVAARDGEVDLDTRLDRYDVTTAEVEAARDGEANLLAKQNTQDQAIAALVVGALLSYVRRTTNFTAAKNTKYLVDAGLTVTLPAGPDDTDQIWFAPLDDMTASNATIGRNGEDIMGLSEDMTWDANVPFSLVYDATNGDWRFGQ